MASWVMGGDVHGCSLRWSVSVGAGAAVARRPWRRRGVRLSSLAIRRRSRSTSCLEGEDTLDALEVDALVGQPLHLAQLSRCRARSSAAARRSCGPARRGPSRSYCRRVCACRPLICGRDRDDVDRRLVGELERLAARRRCSLIAAASRNEVRARILAGGRRPDRPRGPRLAEPSDPLRDGHLDGDEQVAVPVRLGTPRPLTRNVRPEGVPAGTRRVTGAPSRVGTRDVGAERSLGERDRRVRVRWSPRRPKTGCGATCTVM